MIDLTPLFNAFIAVMAALAVRYLVPQLKERITAAQREDFSYWVKVAVKAAEQVYNSDEGGKKKAYVLAFLEENGVVTRDDLTVTIGNDYKLNLTELDAEIEAAVLELHKELSNG